MDMPAQEAAAQDGFSNVAYVEVNTNDFANVGCYVLEDGSQFFDVACIFAANINEAGGVPSLYLNPQVSNVLNDTDAVKVLQELGITVLLTVLGNYEDAGWSCFTDESVATAWAQELADCVEQYGLDGIDIDDEYSTCTPNDTSLIMVTSIMREADAGEDRVEGALRGSVLFPVELARHHLGRDPHERMGDVLRRHRLRRSPGPLP
jgi:hypothetical protein